jgi:uncharacterized protein (TIGR02118 family)
MEMIHVALVGLWTEPADVNAFEREYLGSHVPKLQRLPACRDVRTSRCIDGPFFRFTEAHFESLDAIHAALDVAAGREILVVTPGGGVSRSPGCSERS